MSFEIKEMTVESTNNIHTLVGRIFIPDGEIKGLLHIVHGMTEHIERYEGLMSVAAENGYVAFGFDNLGHGKTARNDEELGFIAHNDGWKYLVNDVAAFTNTVKNMYPLLPVTLMGHSMGSFIARIAAANYGELYDKLIICGTGGKNPLSIAGLALAKIIKAFKGEKYVSDFLINMAFGAYNKRFEGTSKYNWLSKDSAVIEKYAADKFCTFKFTVSAMYDLVKLNHICNQSDWFKRISKTIPILLISGDMDPVGNYGKGVREVYDRLKNSGANAKIKLYADCRHEILNDSCKERVIDDILEFIR